ncbi:hypothetical protein QR680_006486 [Steinernema hermaphroditum]|uniref:Uncharacterized protein n=1 Tax=Steinernema hermaphroditum TaxID=289476 RepID=A0AA39HY14_9BILA|nr:hypothetical protein QR680_006486 [Steinernema hermaphroditum]
MYSASMGIPLTSCGHDDLKEEDEGCSEVSYTKNIMKFLNERISRICRCKTAFCNTKQLVEQYEANMTAIRKVTEQIDQLKEEEEKVASFKSRIVEELAHLEDMDNGLTQDVVILRNILASQEISFSLIFVAIPCSIVLLVISLIFHWRIAYHASKTKSSPSESSPLNPRSSSYQPAIVKTACLLILE